jgi:hypothetical protein
MFTRSLYTAVAPRGRNYHTDRLKPRVDFYKDILEEPLEHTYPSEINDDGGRDSWKLPCQFVPQYAILNLCQMMLETNQKIEENYFA